MTTKNFEAILWFISVLLELLIKNINFMNFHELAIFSKVLELSDRFGLKPEDFNAEITYRYTPDGNKIIELNLMDPKPLAEGKLNRLENAIGARDGEISGSVESLIAILDAALKVSPRKRF